jgi:Rod binding domain-containing protein
MRIDLSSVAAVAQAAPQLKKLEKATQEFEGMFVKQLLETMQRGGSNPFGEGTAGSIYQDLFNNELARNLTARGGFGIGKMMYETISPRVVASYQAINGDNSPQVNG